MSGRYVTDAEAEGLRIVANCTDDYGVTGIHGDHLKALLATRAALLDGIEEEHSLLTPRYDFAACRRHPLCALAARVRGGK